MTVSSRSPRPNVGVWLEWPDGDVSNAGALARRVAFLAVGAARSKACVLHLAAPSALAGVLRARLTEIAGAEGEHWVLHSPAEVTRRDEAAATEAAAAASAAQATVEAATAAFAAIDVEAAAVQSQIQTLSQPLPQGRKDKLLPGPHATREREREAALGQARAAEAVRGPAREEERRIHSDRVQAAGQRAEAAAELVRSRAGRPTEVLEAEPELFAAAISRDLALDGWLVMAPDYDSGANLAAPRAVLMGDGSPASWPLGWPDSEWAPGKPAAVWRARADRLLGHGDPVIVASAALARGDGIKGLGVDAARARVALPAPLDMRALAAPDRLAAAERLRAELAQAAARYLRGFPFEDVRYLVAWSEGTPGLNLRVLTGALRLLIQRDLIPIKVFVASPGGAPEADAWREVLEQGLHHDLVSVPVLSTPALAALIQGAELGLCTAPSAGGGTLMGWSQAISLGVPSLLCDGPDVRETLAHPDLADAVFDPYDAEALAARIKAALAGRASMAEAQTRAYAAMQRTWAAVLDDHLSVLGLGPGGGN